jgi:hypothetical protein
LVYAAGYLDAEGCFRFNRSATVSVTNTYPYTLMFLQGLFGGTIRTKTTGPSQRTAYEWYATGENARNCLQLVLPYLREKKPQADILAEIPLYPRKSVRRQKLELLLKSKKRIDYTTDRMSRETAWIQSEHC